MNYGRRRRAARRTAAERAVWVERLERSGQSALAFAREQDLPLHSLGRWRRQARAVGGVPGVERLPDFQTLSLPGALASDWAAEVEGVGGIRVRVRAGAPVAWVRELIEALR